MIRFLLQSSDTPIQIKDEDFGKFQTGLGQVLHFIKYSKNEEKLKRVVYEDKRYRELDRASANLIRLVTGSELKLKFGEERGKVNMCEALDAMINEGRAEGREETLLETARNVMQSLRVTAEEAMKIMKVPEDMQERLASKL